MACVIKLDGCHGNLYCLCVVFGLKEQYFLVFSWKKWLENPDCDLCPPGKDSWCGFQRNCQRNFRIWTCFTNSRGCCWYNLSNIWGTKWWKPSFAMLAWWHTKSKWGHQCTHLACATKETHASAPTVELATFLAVSHFNDGATILVSILEVLRIVPGNHCIKACKKLDHDRIRHSRHKSGEA